MVGAKTRRSDDGELETVAGELVLGPEAPKAVVLAMGRYCACNRNIARAYPSVCGVALRAWQKGKPEVVCDGRRRRRISVFVNGSLPSPAVDIIINILLWVSTIKRWKLTYSIM